LFSFFLFIFPALLLLLLLPLFLPACWLADRMDGWMSHEDGGEREEGWGVRATPVQHVERTVCRAGEGTDSSAHTRLTNVSIS